MKKSSASLRLTPKRSQRQKTILIPVDFSPASGEPIRWAKFIARKNGARIQFVHVYDSGHPLTATLMQETAGSATLERHLRRRLEALATRSNPPNGKPVCHIRNGRSFIEVCKLAEQIGADLIAISTHGRTSWDRALLGSTAERILRHAPCPVLIVRLVRGKKRTAPRLKRILVPVDFSECSFRGAQYAARLAGAFDARLTFVHVVSPEHYPTPVVVYTDKELSQFAAGVAEVHMKSLLAKLRTPTLQVSSAIKIGAPARTICRYARQVKADAIVVSTHGRTGLRHVVIGSVAELIARYANVPVLVYPTRKRR